MHRRLRTPTATLLGSLWFCLPGAAWAAEPSAAGADSGKPRGADQASAPAAAPQPAAAEATPEPSTLEQVAASLWSKVKLSTQWFLAYESGQQGGDSHNQFNVSRGYVTLKFKPVKWFQPRITVDTHQDDDGSWAVRLKYLYGKFVAPVETPVVSEPNIELGIVHNPWFDYEEHVNRYRAEGAMFIERNKSLNSADLGITAGALIGPKLDQEYCDRVSSEYPGKYGSFAVGLYNGGGYHAAEENQSKVFMSRLSLRPLGFVLPHWQISHFFIYGNGNTAAEPRWQLHGFLTSVEHEYFVVTGQITMGEGNQKGDKVAALGESLDFFGYSVFGEIKLPWILSSLIGRYDYFDWGLDGGDSPTSRVIAGHAFHFLPHNFLLASLDYVSYADPGIPSDRIAKLTLQVQYP